MKYETRSNGLTLPPALVFDGEDLSHHTDWQKFVKLNCMDRSWLTEDKFLGLFIKCDVCALITMLLMFYHHHCKPDDLDLTDRE